MIRRRGCALAFFPLLLLGIAAGIGQTPGRPGDRQSAMKWTPPRTPDDQIDLQGVWEMSTLTPLERPAEFAGKAVLTEQEAAAHQKRTLEQLNSDRRDGGREDDLRRNYNEYWRDRGAELKPNLRTSLIIDPPDGRIPPFTPEGRKRRDAQMAASRNPSGPEDLALRIRCISRGLPMVPTPNNNFFQIVQSQGFVAILQEMMYEVRLIPLDTRPHVSPKVRSYMGDPRAHWEGGTLVIDTTNFLGDDDFLGADENLHLVERLTRTAPDTILYQFTVDDPTAFTRPWSGEIPMTRTTEGIFPYECHEGNYAMTDILSGARAEEREAANAGGR
jgi:hypothetical protein